MAATLTFRLAHVEDVTAIVGLVQSAYRGDTSRTGEVQPFPYGDERFGVPRRNDLAFAVLAEPLR